FAFLGTPGAYTQCHYDSYGYNVHAQLSGSKRWILFEPGEDMRPTRMPYEESTIFSNFDVIGAENALRTKKIRMVTLNKGDVIFVPPEWWHCVQCVPVNGVANDLDNLSVSVNTWVSLADHDQIARVHEAATSTLVIFIDFFSMLVLDLVCFLYSIAFLNRAGLIDPGHLCPSEAILSYDDSLFDLNRVINEAKVGKAEADESMSRLHNFVAKHLERLTVVPVVSFDEFRTVQEKGPLKIVDFADQSSSSAAALHTVSSFQKRFIDALLSEKVLDALIVQLRE
ncbi:unnamed protein product, partial [Gongylonema pulchrum]|uniref:JmjC domain-containing protein n=1 Tax=Gongylonema pulchrum TaxID=637853 RepID=A0A183DTE0_9BILA